MKTPSRNKTSPKPQRSAAKTPPVNSGRFQKGVSGNPRGKPTGSRNTATVLAEKLIEGEAEEITRATIQLALKGDPTALRLVFERLVPLRKGRSIRFKSPPIKSTHDAVQALASILDGLSKGELTSCEAADAAGVIEIYRRTVETNEFEARLAALEKANEGR